MKVILSRKGFDSSNGGIVSPIFPDGTPVSLPIPSLDYDAYCDFQQDGINYYQILQDLGYKGTRWHCHADPDLDESRRLNKEEGWIPAFGQASSALGYLNKMGIEKGDVFLFFGNFHFVRIVSGHLQYEKNTGDFNKDSDIQMIWGYMQVGDILDTVEKQDELWWHPHACGDAKMNTIFTASKTLSFDPSKPGTGILPFDKKRVLTLEGETKATWKKNTVYDVDNIIGNRRNSAKDPEKGIYYSGIWQELGLKETASCIEWMKSIID